MWGIPETDTTPYFLDDKGQPKAIGGGGQTINVGGNNDIGTIPSGMVVRRDAAGNVIGMEPIPGGPAAADAAAAATKGEKSAGQDAVVTDTIINEAQKARGLIGPATTGAGGWALSKLPFTEAATLYQHVAALQSIAASENIQAMREASKTGGALGNASDADIQLLKDKAGALNPASPNFPQMLDDYERTLLRIVHGPEAGDRLFEESRPAGTVAPAEEEVEQILRELGL